ncbi:piggyBac transposable element-derived protein 4-like [Colletes gigas]|uniref:piggyBac transposable element-derived protein 4-like n=1 Tax=Colletes gigas TaxID=935657 RepID=UPI001C9ACED0|nr:piggyBac transposable element-derived protein 4-like [Colletes gigas]
MSRDTEEIYADPLSDIDSDTDKVSMYSDEDSDSDSDIMRRVRSQALPSWNDSDEDENNPDDESKWLEIDIKPEFHNFIGQSGVQIPTEDLNDVKAVTKLVIGDDLMNLFVTESNRYRYQNSSNSSTGKNKEWTDISITEMKQFLGLIIVMGFVKKSEKDEYWSTDPLLCTPIFGNTMSRNRFRQIWRYWHFSNNDNCQNRLDKIRPVLTYVTEKFQTVYKPQKELFLDENVIPWGGRLSSRKYNPAKLIKYGILVRMVCEAVSGYICKLEIYCAQGKTLQTTIFSTLHPFLNLCHHIYMDTYYNSTKITEKLLEYETGVCGTIRKNRGVPNCLKNVNLKENTTAYRRKNNTLIQAWKTKKKLVYMISTIHSADMVEIINHKTHEKMSKPICVAEYDKYMKSVDRADQYLSYYPILRKTKKWTKKTTLYLLNCALFNAYIIYTKLSGSNMRYKKFLFAVARVWLDSTQETTDVYPNDPEPSTSTKRAPKYEPTGRLCSDMKKHRIVKIMGQGKIKNPRRPCRVCTAAKKRSSTAFMCSSCGVPLHVGKCFQNYHTLSKY